MCSCFCCLIELPELVSGHGSNVYVFAQALHRAPLQRFWAVDASPDANAPTSGAGYDWTQLIATEAGQRGRGEVESVRSPLNSDGCYFSVDHP